MMALWMTYGMMVGAILWPAGWLIEKALRGRDAPGRPAWMLAMLFTFSLPLVTLLPAASGSPEPELPGSGPSATPVAAPVTTIWTMDAPLRAAAASDFPLDALDGPLSIAWAIMSFGLGAWLFAAWVGLRRRRREWRDATIAGERILVSPDTGPAATGLFPSRIVLPEWSLAADSEALSLMVAHEREHIRARDPLTLGAAATMVVLMPWNAALWWQAARLRLALELDCDARVVRGSADTRRYGDLLIDVARGESRWMLATAGLSRRSSLERRIRMLARRPLWSRTAAGTAFACALLLVVVSCGLDRPDGGATAEPIAVAPPPAAEARQAELERAGRRHFEAVRTAIERRHPEILTEGVPGEIVYVWLLANTRGVLERTAIDTAKPDFMPVELVQTKFPDLHPRDLGRAGVSRYGPGSLGPDTVVVMWWQRPVEEEGSSDVFQFGVWDRRPSAATIRHALAEHHAAVLSGEDVLDDEDVWFLASGDDEVLATGRHERFRTSDEFARMLEARYGARTSSILMTSAVENDDGHSLSIVWGTLDPDSDPPISR